MFEVVNGDFQSILVNPIYWNSVLLSTILDYLPVILNLITLDSVNFLDAPSNCSDF